MKAGTAGLLQKGGLLTGSVVVALLFAELLTRIVYPISAGQRLVSLTDEPVSTWLQPSATYRQVSTEYDALTTITADGYRAPQVVGNPDVVFLGNSMTFGWGLSDDETFISIYCRRMMLTCANLGAPGR